jgi:predicted PhzF superfamily epimerase YddE/YHI9
VSVSVDVVSVFIDDDDEFGNLLGIVRSSDASAGRERELAATLGFSETVFIEHVVDGVATIRIMTPGSELPFAGHPSVGTSWWFAQHGIAVSTLAVPAGDVAVRYDGELTWITGRAEWVFDFQWLPLGTPANVDALDPATFEGAPSYAYAWIDEDAGELRSRMFAPELGIAEDEATGAAAVAMTTRLGRDLSILQGRGSRILTRQLSGGFVEVGGRTAFVEKRTLD